VHVLIGGTLRRQQAGEIEHVVAAVGAMVRFDVARTVQDLVLDLVPAQA
jgi:hypothetical protein